MVASQIRTKARESLTGKWGKVALMTLIFTIMLTLIGLVVGLFTIIPFIGSLISIGYCIIGIPLSYGILVSFVKVKRGEEVDYMDFFSIAFTNFGRVWGIIGHAILKFLPYIICLIVGIVLMIITSSFSFIAYIGRVPTSLYSSAGFMLLSFLSFILIFSTYIAFIPKFFSLSLIFLLLNDNPSMSGKEIVEKSISLMNGHRWNLFWLYFTFIGWAILAVFTFYIGYFFLAPYMTISFICFYEALCNKEMVKEVAEQKVTKQTIVQEEIVEEQEENNPIQSKDDKNNE